MEENIIGLYTIPKSGTNYFRIFLVNYLFFLSGENKQPRNYSDLEREFPTLISSYIKDNQIKKCHPLTSQFGYTDFCYNHGRPLPETPKGRYVMLYRNPLDYLVSQYYYSYEHRKETAGNYTSPMDIIDKVFTRFIGNYPVMKAISNDKEEYLLICYEDLFEFPEETFKRVIMHYKLPFNELALEFALTHSSFNNVRKYEDITNKRLHAKNGGINFIEGTKFTRNGSIGQWQEYFSDKDIKIIEEKLMERDISLDEFRLHSKDT
jgi:hypothetical protein